MFLKQLEYLIAVIEEDHFGRAASRCNVKQPSLSNGIKQLELELGVTLFKRGRGQRLYGVTEEGKRVAEALCMAYKEASNVDIRIARIFNTYGPYMLISDHIWR